MPSRDGMVNWDVRYADCSSSVEHVAFELLCLILFWMLSFPYELPMYTKHCPCSLDNAGVHSLI
jgi:hypothetical protein